MKIINVVLLALFCFSGAAFAAGSDELESLRKEAEAGTAGAQFAYALELVKIEGKAEEAVSWVRKSADQGLADAQAVLGEIYFDGSFGVTKDIEKAVEWLDKAALQGQKDAQRYMGIYMWNKAEADTPGGCAWFRLSKSQPNIELCEEEMNPEEKKAAEIRFKELKKRYPY